jgi:hypothetical protein
MKFQIDNEVMPIEFKATWLHAGRFFIKLGLGDAVNLAVFIGGREPLTVHLSDTWSKVLHVHSIEAKGESDDMVLSWTYER